MSVSAAKTQAITKIYRQRFQFSALQLNFIIVTKILKALQHYLSAFLFLNLLFKTSLSIFQNHTILLIQPNPKLETRTYSDFENIDDCLEGLWNFQIVNFIFMKAYVTVSAKRFLDCIKLKYVKQIILCKVSVLESSN